MTASNLTVPARADQLAVIGDFVTTAAQAAGLGERATYHVQAAVDEACANVIYHAYEYEGQGPIEVCCECKRNDFVVTITDYGRSFDPSSVPVPDTSAGLDDRKEGGLGLFLIHKLMDEVHYQFNTHRNVRTLVKRLR